jgi:hypothetical protein
MAAPGRSPALDAGQLEVLRRYGTERDVAAGEVLFADGDETYDLIVMLDGTAEIIQGHGRPGATLIAGNKGFIMPNGRHGDPFTGLGGPGSRVTLPAAGGTG